MTNTTLMTMTMVAVVRVVVLLVGMVVVRGLVGVVLVYGLSRMNRRATSLSL